LISGKTAKELLKGGEHGSSWIKMSGVVYPEKKGG